MDRRQKLLSGLDILAQRGAEIGALCRPLVRRPEGNIIYIDYADTSTLIKKYANDPNVIVEDIVEVDAIWGEGAVQDALGLGEKVDYILASHVIEHVPDLITWLNELTSVLTPEGTIRLAIPDKRFCFDYLRQLTCMTDVLAAYFNKSRRPSSRQILDFSLHYRDVVTSQAWVGNVDNSPPYSRVLLDNAFAAAEAGERGQYIDVHCWTFTLESFATLMEQLVQLGLIHLRCEVSYDVLVNDLEFLVIAGRCEDPHLAAASWALVAAEAKARRQLDEDTQLAALVSEKARLESSLRLISKLEGDLEIARSQLAAVQNSTSWRATVPLRALVERLRGT